MLHYVALHYITLHYIGNWNNLFSTVTVLQTERPGFDYWQGKGLILFTTASRLALGPTQPLTQLVPSAKAGGARS